MGLVPMYLSQTKMTTLKFESSLTFEFAPMSVAEYALKVLQFANAVPRGDGFNLNNLSDHLEILLRKAPLPAPPADTRASQRRA